MAKKDYMPSTDKDKSVWLKNFAGKLPAYSSVLQISDDEIQSINNDANAFAYTLDCMEMVKTYNLQMTAYKDTLRDGASKGDKVNLPMPLALPPAPPVVEGGVFVRIRRLVQNIKTQKAYTDDIGKALGLIGETTTIDYNSLKPELKTMLTGGKVVVKWKRGKADSINMYVKRGTNDFVLAGNDAKPPYDDPTPLPAEATTWIYKAMYVVKDQEVGQFSNEVSILVQKGV